MTRPPGDYPGEGYGSSSEYPSAESTDWFSPRAAGSSSAATPVPPPADPQASGQQPEWFTPRGSGGFTGASDPGGHSYGGTPTGSSAANDPYGDQYLAAPTAGPGTSYDRPFPTGPGESSGGTGGPGDGSGSYDYGSGGYGASRKKRKKSALIGPLAGAVGLSLLLGVAVYAFAEKSGSCTGKAITLNVSVAPEIAPAVTSAAKTFTDSKQSVGDSCVVASVAAADPSAVRTVLTGEGVSGAQSAKPDVWIPDTSLWTGLVQQAAPKAVTTTKTSLASSPIVVAVPKTLYGFLQQKGFLEAPSWDNLLKAVGGLEGGAITKNDVIPPNLLDMRVLNPVETGPGMASISMLRTLLASDAAKDTIFAGVSQTIRNHTSQSEAAQYARFRRDSRGRFPLLITPEQSVFRFNAKKRPEPAIAIYPEDGMVNLDYPVVVSTADPDKAKAAALLEKALATPEAVQGYQALGFRTADRKAPATFTPARGLSPKRIRPLPIVSPEEIYKITQDWSKLSLPMRMLSILDISGTMNQPLGPGKPTRMNAILQIAAKGLERFPPDAQVGTWVFSTDLVGTQDWKEVVPIEELTKRTGSTTQLKRIQQGLLTTQAIPTGNTGLYETILGAYKHMKKTYQVGRINSIVLFTDGLGQDNPGGLTHAQVMSALGAEIDKNKPIQVVVISIGSDQKVLKQLQAITKPTGGAAYIPRTPEEIQLIFLKAIAKRMCTSEQQSAGQC